MELYKHRELDVWQLIKIVCLRLLVLKYINLVI